MGRLGASTGRRPVAAYKEIEGGRFARAVSWSGNATCLRPGVGELRWAVIRLHGMRYRSELTKQV